MLNALKSVLRGQALQSAGKAAIFAVLLFSAQFHWFWAVVFVLAAFYFYFPGAFKFSFLFFTAASLFSIYWLAGHSSFLYPTALAAAGFGFLFFLFISVKNLVFINREGIYHFLHNFSLFFAFLFFFASDHSRWFLTKFLVLYAALYFLFKEFFSEYFRLLKKEADFLPMFSKVNLLSAVFAFINAELIWATALLPIGFLNQSAFALVFNLAIKDLTSYYLSGDLSRLTILKNITLFLIFGLIIFMASKWAL